MFYTKTIEIYKKNMIIDEYGIVKQGEMSLLDIIKADVQPVGIQMNPTEYGISKDVKYMIFSPLNKNLSEESYIGYEGQVYKIIRMEKWDDFIEFLVGKIDD